MRKLTIGLIFTICIITAVCASSAIAGNSNPDLVVTYGETTYANQQYVNSVNNYFASKGYTNLGNANTEVISASQVNAISQGISGKTYNSNQIFSSALVDLNQGDNLKVTVDSSKITLVTAKMYASALESAGIQKGIVYVTSPISATGESALAGVMSCYEKATNVEIPQEVKQAANEEIYVQAEVVNNTNANPDQISQIVDDVKGEVEKQNITDMQSIVDVVNETAQKYNIQISNADIEKIAEAIYNTFNVQDQANAYKDKLEAVLS
ncbi:MAG: DUF1002 domain-containing protein [Methanobrevibacter sp.]|uniref:DUF1002 domain-containing protein n=1 Tax=Methanobrevibacter sp. TaxID=66852 RepID=UPI0026E076E9|nr:DUF1002 domain-containing protein [Methanobrevibacter sp.]MDO5847952.1 DUF1002 domain-containing protein [Methanobrevibacter sp.]